VFKYNFSQYLNKTISNRYCKDVRFIFCDISKAFDRVWHRGLLYKLRKYGIKGNLLTWFGSYLSDRKQRVCMNGYYSTWNYINAGVPQ
jgi:methylaspartate ammonia-lyase